MGKTEEGGERGRSGEEREGHAGAREAESSGGGGYWEEDNSRDVPP